MQHILGGLQHMDVAQAGQHLAGMQLMLVPQPLNRYSAACSAYALLADSHSLLATFSTGTLAQAGPFWLAYSSTPSCDP